jgi:hypothetical protein
LEKKKEEEIEELKKQHEEDRFVTQICNTDL